MAQRKPTHKRIGQRAAQSEDVNRQVDQVSPWIASKLNLANLKEISRINPIKTQIKPFRSVFDVLHSDKETMNELEFS